MPKRCGHDQGQGAKRKSCERTIHHPRHPATTSGGSGWRKRKTAHWGIPPERPAGQPSTATQPERELGQEGCESVRAGLCGEGPDHEWAKAPASLTTDRARNPCLRAAPASVYWASASAVATAESARMKPNAASIQDMSSPAACIAFPLH